MTSATLSPPTPRSTLGRWALGATAVLFGVATLVEGGHVLFGGPAARAEAGNVVPFVLLLNFGAGFAYVTAGLAALLGRSWATWLARALAVATLGIFVLSRPGAPPAPPAQTPPAEAVATPQPAAPPAAEPE